MSEETNQLTVGDLKILRAALEEVPVKGVESSRRVVAIAEKLDTIIAVANDSPTSEA